MKCKMLALILALTVASWAQTATPTPSTAPQSTVPAAKAKCCDKMAPTDAKDAPACCAHHDMNGKGSKDMASCCAGKNATSGTTDAMACIRKDKDKAASCCKEGCGKDGCAKDKTASACCAGSCCKDGKGCCSGKNTEKSAKNCRKEELHS